MAIAALVCACVGLACYGVPSLIGVVLGIVSLNQIKQTGQQGRGMALAGIIVGGVVISIWILFLIIIVVVAAGNDARYS